jgi:pimeloyl-ACP methyl ester carboxylesterase
MPHPHSKPFWSRISTNVRLSLVRRGLAALSRLAPGLAATAAERLFFTPPRPRPSRGEALLARARRFDVRGEEGPVAAWQWGRGPAVVLLHGWGGRAAQLSSFVAPLQERGFSVVAFDAPGHGRSGRGLSSAPQFARALRGVSDAVGGAHAVVAHSLGAAAVALAMRDGLDARRVVFLAPPADPPAWVGPFAARFGLAPAVVERMRERSERRIGRRWEELDVPRLVPPLEAPLLVVHDREDAEVPVWDGARIAAAWPGARLLETTGLGHQRLLRDPEVVARAVAFVADGVRPGCPRCGRPLSPGEASCERCALELELFDRESRAPDRRAGGPREPFAPSTAPAGR